MTASSYVEAVKQVEILLALVIGWLVFGEGAADSPDLGLAAPSRWRDRDPHPREGVIGTSRRRAGPSVQL